MHFELRKPTGKGFENYPTNEPVSWIDKYYFTPYRFVEDNLKEPAKEPENTQTPTTSPIPETPIEPESDNVPQSSPDVPSEPPSVDVPGDSVPSGTNESDDTTPTISDTIVYPPDDLVPPPSKRPSFFEKIKAFFSRALKAFLKV